MKPESPEREPFPEWEPQRLPEWLAETPPEREWVLKGILPRQAINMLSGQQKWTQKTYLALAISLLVASGKRFGPLIPGTGGPVLYLLEEGERAETAERIHAIQRGLGIRKPPKDLFLSHHAGIELDDPEWSDRLAELVEREGVVLTVLDTLTSLKNCDENKTEEMKWVVDAVKRLVAIGSSVLVIAHLRKSASPNEDPDNQVRGSGILGQLRDNHLAIRNWKRESVSTCTLLQRGGPSIEYLIRWDLENETLTDEDGDEYDRLVRAFPEIVRLSGKSYLAKVTAPVPKEDPKMAVDIAPLCGVPPWAARRFAQAAADEGVFKKQGTLFVKPNDK